MSKSVWVVEQGCYSDYRVVGVFTSKANAEIMADKIKTVETYDKVDVSEWPFDPCIDEINKGLSVYRISMEPNGKTISCEEECARLIEAEGSLRVAGERSNIPHYVYGLVWAKNRQHAVKTANEFRIRAIANNEIKTA